MPTPLPPGLVRLGRPLPGAVHPEAALLGRCAAAGLPVPAGAVLLAGSDDLGPLAPGSVLLRVPGCDSAVRVATGDPAVLAAAVRTARLTTAAGARADLLVLRAVDPVHAGHADLTGDGPVVVRAVEGEAHRLAHLQDDRDVRELLVPHLGRFGRAHRGADPWRTPLPPWGMRLSRLLRDVRRRLGPDAVTAVTWADDGRSCRLLGVASPG